MAINPDDFVFRPATLDDVEGIGRLIRSYPDELIARPPNSIIENIDRFTVAVSEEGEIVACACWQILPEIGNPGNTTVELQSVAVKRELRSGHIGTRLIRTVLGRIVAFRPAQALVLTYAPGFFRTLGFREIAKTQIMHKIYLGCIYCTKHSDPFTCPEIAMALDLHDYAR
ncbi:MAG: GNAT family N-acetyltransferase [Kiritimatiellia bacterium]|nr:GNAT family N-acetyltransferase [Kiritimatiellia bacterium]